jgi:hypothetical protein
MRQSEPSSCVEGNTSAGAQENGMGGTCNVTVTNSDRKRPLARRILQYNIKIDRKKIDMRDWTRFI